MRGAGVRRPTDALAREQFEIDLLREPPERAIADVAGLMPGAGLDMVCDDAEDVAADVDAVDGVQVQPIEERSGNWDTSLLVSERPDASINHCGGRRLAGEAFREPLDRQCGPRGRCGHAATSAALRRRPAPILSGR